MCINRSVYQTDPTSNLIDKNHPDKVTTFQNHYSITIQSEIENQFPVNTRIAAFKISFNNFAQSERRFTWNIYQSKTFLIEMFHVELRGHYLNSINNV